MLYDIKQQGSWALKRQRAQVPCACVNLTQCTCQPHTCTCQHHSAYVNITQCTSQPHAVHVNLKQNTCQPHTVHISTSHSHMSTSHSAHINQPVPSKALKLSGSITWVTCIRKSNSPSEWVMMSSLILLRGAAATTCRSKLTSQLNVSWK